MHLNRARARSLCASLLLWVAFATAAPSGASAEDTAAPNGEALYQERTCIACHGPDASTPILPEYPKIAGQNEAYILRQIRDIKSGARNNGNTAAMAGVLHLVNDEEIEALAKYLSGLSPCP
jgi:cytochrome c